MKEIFLELIKEACNGKVIVDGEEWPYSFNTIIEDRDFYENEDNNVTLVIKNLDKLIEKIEEYKSLAHRRLTIDAMNYLRTRSIYPNSLPQLAVELTTMAEVNAFATKYKEVVFKAPWSGSGKGVFWSSGQLTPSLSGWCKRVIEKQGSVMGEVAYDRVQDFAMEFKVGRGDVAFAGYSLFFTEGSGIYRGNYLLSNEDIETEEAAIELYQAELVYESALSTTAGVIKKTLLDYL